MYHLILRLFQVLVIFTFQKTSFVRRVYLLMSHAHGVPRPTGIPFQLLSPIESRTRVKVVLQVDRQARPSAKLQDVSGFLNFLACRIVIYLKVTHPELSISRRERWNCYKRCLYFFARLQSTCILYFKKIFKKCGKSYTRRIKICNRQNKQMLNLHRQVVELEFRKYPLFPITCSVSHIPWNVLENGAVLPGNLVTKIRDSTALHTDSGECL